MPGRVDHVVNFDFPLNAVDYLHRTGRTARAGATGAITSLVTRRDQVQLSFDSRDTMRCLVVVLLHRLGRTDRAAASGAITFPRRPEGPGVTPRLVSLPAPRPNLERSK